MPTPLDAYAKLCRWQPYEIALLVLGFCSLSALGLHSSAMQRITAELAAANVLLVLVVLLAVHRAVDCPWCQRLRLACAYGYILWFFNAVRQIVPALHIPLYDDVLLFIDRLFLKETPAALIAPAFWLTEIASAAYLSYLVYLHVALLRHGLADLERARRFWNYLFVAYAFGFAGYLLVPAVGPKAAFPHLFPTPLGGGWLGLLNEQIVARGSAVYDVFPSLHILITCVILDFEYRLSRSAFWCVLPFVLLIFLSTIYLRYHYAVDLVAGAVCFLLVRRWYSYWENAQGR